MQARAIDTAKKKLVKYLDDIALAPEEKLHGLVLAAACDFSKKARDDFAKKCLAMELEEWHLWGKAELEDVLVRPENDGLLFAYFGISLTIRRRSQRTELRAKLAMKRKANRILGKVGNSYVLLRSPDASGYPYSGDIPNFDKEPPWVVRTYVGMAHDGLKFLARRHFAYLADDGESWDAAFALNDARAHRHEDPWSNLDRHTPLRQECWDAWQQLPETNRAWLDVIALVAFEDVLDIDELGDDYVQSPHVYVQFVGLHGPFVSNFAEVKTLPTYGERQQYLYNFSDKRVVMFPAHLREERGRVGGKA